nr:hypothetical protein [Streptomyces albus]
MSSERAGDFPATADILDLGGVQVSTMAYPPMTVRRTPRLIRRSDPDFFQLSLTFEGTMGLEQAGAGRGSAPATSSSTTPRCPSRAGPGPARDAPGRSSPSSPRRACRYRRTTSPAWWPHHSPAPRNAPRCWPGSSPTCPAVPLATAARTRPASRRSCSTWWPEPPPSASAPATPWRSRAGIAPCSSGSRTSSAGSWATRASPRTRWRRHTTSRSARCTGSSSTTA